MTDRELLELAAKAAGIKNILWHESAAGGWVRSLNGHPWWNPLTDDGDAFRLAVKLRMFRIGEVWVIEQTSISEWDRDPYAATRRAIVRAAAEIGKGMP